MVIINADDFGKNRLATDRILHCYKHGKVTSASAMVFMEDSRRAAYLALERGIDLGLHLNFTEKLTQKALGGMLCDYHAGIAGFLTRRKDNFLFYNPRLRKQFAYVYNAQLEEFNRIYGSPPSHIDGHHHMHLCTNVLVDSLIPVGQKVRRNFSYNKGEKNALNLIYRRFIDKWLMKKYLTTDYFYSLPERIKNGRLPFVVDLAKSSIVELETHPEHEDDYKWLMGADWDHAVSSLHIGSYADL